MSEQLLTHEEDEKNIELESYWLKDQEAVQEMLLNGAEAYFSSINKETLEDSSEQKCACIDERVGGNKLALPGSGILYGEKKAYELLKESGVTSISSHADCGAAALAFDKLSKKEKEYYGSPDQYAKEFTESLARKLGIAYDGHEDVETPGLHIARTIYYDASGSFRADTEGLPKGFTIDHKLSSTEDAKDSLDLAIKIAMGHHGFSDKFDSNNPLLIIPIGDSKILDKLQEEISEVIQRDNSWADRIKLDKGITVEPEEKEEIVVGAE